MKILMIHSSLTFDLQKPVDTNSHKIGKYFKETIKEINSKVDIQELDLNTHHFGESKSITNPVVYEKAIQQFKESDLVIFFCPLYNFSIPGTLKNYIDHIVKPRLTFQFVNERPQGLLQNKYIGVYIRGGFYQNTPIANLLHDESYLDTILSFIGMKKIKSFYAEGFGIKNEKNEFAHTTEQWFTNNKKDILQTFKNLFLNENNI